MSATCRVILADDHPHAREAIRSVLAESDLFTIVGEATTGPEAFELCRQQLPDLVLMDIHMPVWDGLEATRKIKEAFPTIKIVILSVSDNIKDLFAAIQLGAQGYLLKNMDPDDWLAYLHSLIQGNTETSRELAGRIFYQFREGTNEDPLPSVLTSREKEILKYVASGVTNREIAKTLVIAENTVKNHIKNLLEKLQLENRVQLASYAVRHGLTRQGQK
ncbi:response regulator [Brevibacillus massiliensis]|uniref:response regulator n=1 Tax=Brevibacillus massiliensis TaxID=1118054 RepID=UPI0002F39427|nr:response regulator transcription factor [Brevibacillus massiliensis]